MAWPAERLQHKEFKSLKCDYRIYQYQASNKVYLHNIWRCKSAAIGQQFFVVAAQRDFASIKVYLYNAKWKLFKSCCHVLDLYFSLCVEERPALAWWISRFFGNSKQFYKAMIRMRVQFWLNIMNLILQNHIFPSFLLYICIL